MLWDTNNRPYFNHTPKHCDVARYNHIQMRNALRDCFGTPFTESVDILQYVGTNVLSDEQFQRIAEKCARNRIADAKAKHENEKNNKEG